MAICTGIRGAWIVVIAGNGHGRTSTVDTCIRGAIVPVITVDVDAGTSVDAALIVVGADVSVIAGVGVEIIDAIAIQAAVVCALISIGAGKGEVVAGFFDAKVVGACVAIIASTVVGTGEAVFRPEALSVSTAFRSAIGGTSTPAFSLRATAIPAGGSAVEFARAGIFAAGTDAVAAGGTL